MFKKKTLPVYEKMMEELMNAYVGTDIIEQVFNLQELDKESIPKRYRLIALGFLKHETLDELNDNLMNNGCQPLYSRSDFEVTLIYAFANQLSYSEWKRIALACETAKRQWKENLDYENGNMFFQNKYITFGELEQYVLTYSEKGSSELITKHITQVLDRSIRSLDSNYAKFFQFYVSNLQEFSSVREKSRYYFCKYLYEYLKAKIERYKTKVGNHIPNQENLMELLPLKVESVLRRKKTHPDDLMDILRECAISPAAIFEEFNYYYFEYVSLDWIDLLLENVNDINDLSEEQVRMVAEYLRKNASRKEWSQIKGFEDKKMVHDYIQIVQSENREIQTNRKGENAIRKYLRGDLDIDRTTLICFLLFWGSNNSNRNEIKITENRMNDILDECGFSMLRAKAPFDNFVLHYIKSKDPVSYLMEEMDQYLKRGETIFIHEVYAHSCSNAKEIRKKMSL